jgi:predicted nucleotidyltransferase
LPDDAIEEIRGVFSSHAFVQKAWLCGSRAQGLAKHNSDIDLALEGEISVDELGKIHSLLESLPLPYLFDIVDKSKITDESFLEHINTYGKLIYSK